MRLTLVALFTILFLSTSAVAEGRVCVLSFERAAHPFSKMAEEVFGDSSAHRVIHEASPLDLKKCIEDDFSEIIIIAHALQMDRTGERYNLEFLQRLSPKNRAALLERGIARREKKLEELRKKEKALEELDWDPERQEQEREDLYFARYELEREIDKLRNLPEDVAFYDRHPIMPRAFELARAALAEKRRRGDRVALKKIRIASCVPEIIAKTYTPLIALTAENAIELEWGPRDWLLSLRMGKEVTRVTKRWLRKSLKD